MEMVMVMTHAFTAIVGCALVACTVAAGAQPAPSVRPARPPGSTSTIHDGPWLGTWQRRNPTPSPETWIMTWWKEGDGLRYTIDVTRPGGAPTHMEAFVRFDGRPYPETGNPSADHNIFERIDDRTLVLRDMKDGKESIRFRITYSADGKVRTSVSSRTNANGETVTSTGIWDRVEFVQAQARPAPPSAGPWMGLWKFNAEKSAAANRRPAPSGPQNTRLFRMVPVRQDAFKYTIESVPAGGGPATVNAELIGRFDGQDYIEIGNPGADTNRFRIVDSHTYEVVDTMDGKDLMTIKVMVSPDGKTRTSVNSAGIVSIYERVE